MDRVYSVVRSTGQASWTQMCTGYTNSVKTQMYVNVEKSDGRATR